MKGRGIAFFRALHTWVEWDGLDRWGRRTSAMQIEFGTGYGGVHLDHRPQVHNVL